MKKYKDIVNKSAEDLTEDLLQEKTKLETELQLRCLILLQKRLTTSKVLKKNIGFFL